MSTAIDEVLRATGGKLLSRGEDDFSGFIIDSRKASEKASGGDLFFPLPGENTDGHRYIAKALQNGAVGALMEESWADFVRNEPIPPGKTLILVENIMQAMHQLALFNRQKHPIPLIAVTGSNGKTTTKDLIASVLAVKYNVLKTEANYNNHLGLPLMLLSLNQDHEVAVLEMGMSGLGEIAFLASLALPSLGVITNIGEAHLASLGSRDNIAQAKNELLVSMGAGGKAFLNRDDPYLRKMGADFPGQAYYFGDDQEADLRLLDYSTSSGGGSRFAVYEAQAGDLWEFLLPLPGRHNINNALAAIALGLHFGLNYEEIKTGLDGAEITGMRMEIRQAEGGFQVVNDAYNASPTSMKAALETLVDLAGEKKMIAVLGDMLELGDLTEEGHLEVGRYLAALAPEHLVTVGESAALIAQGAAEAGFPEEKIFKAESSREALEHLCSLELQDSCILLKGSRKMRLEQLSEELLRL